MKKNKLGLVIPTFNDKENFLITFISISSVLKYFNVVVVDSSLNDDIKEIIKNYDNIKYFKIPANGVYNALNYGIRKLKTDFLISVNSGDKFNSDFFLNFYEKNDKMLNQFDLFVFNQIATINEKPIYKFKPNFNTLFPHQSVIYKRKLHKEISFFSEKYKLISDQIFFNEAKLKYKIKFIDEVLSTYDLNGLSSKISMSNIKEWKILNDTLCENNIYNNFKFYLKILLKLIISPFKNSIIILKIKATINSNYKLINDY